MDRHNAGMKHAATPGRLDGPDSNDEVAMLLALCAQADTSAFRQLYDRQSPMLYGVALRITRDASMASDAVHDAMLQVWRNAARFDPARGQARAWLVSLVRYRALDAINRTRREVLGAEVPEPVDPDPLPLERLQTTREGEALHRCLQEIEAERRSLVVLAFVEGLTHSEVALRVKQPLGTVKSSIRRALMALRTCLGREAA
jgi:RNA polymerase sigma-70 factor (ECF subfamily)